MPHYDLDTIASEARSGYEEFTFSAGGETFTLPKPTDLEWRHRMLLLRDAEAGLRAIWGAKEFNRFNRARPNSYGFDQMARHYLEYLGSGEDKGEPSGSTGS